MKSISSAFSSHLAGQATTLARCWKLVRTDGKVFAFTTADRTLTLPNSTLAVVQSGNTEVDAVLSSTDVQVTLPQVPTNGNLLIAFLSGDCGDGMPNTIIDTSQWTVQQYSNPASGSVAMWILTRYATSTDGAVLPSFTNDTLSEFATMAATVQEIGGVTGDISVDVPYSNIVYNAGAGTVDSGTFTATDPFAFAVVGASAGGTSGVPTFPAGWVVDQAVPKNTTYNQGCAHVFSYTDAVQAAVTFVSGDSNAFVGIVGMNVPGLDFEPSQGFMSTAMENKADLSVDNVEVQGAFDSETITVEDIRAGLFDYASIFIYLVNWADITMGVLALRRGALGEVTSSPQGWFKAELRGITQLLQQQIIELYGPECRADVGDNRCGVPIDPPLWRGSNGYNIVVNQVNKGAWVKAPLNANADYSAYENVIFECTTAGQSGSTQPSFSTTVGDTTSDGSVTWTTRAAWTRDGAVDTVIDPLNITVTWTLEDDRDVDGWYQYGTLVFDTGNNKGRALEVKAWVQSSEQITFYLPAGYPVQVGDKFHVNPGCDKSNTTCKAKFANLLNMRAEPYLPGNDFVFYYPNAQGPGTQAR